MWFTKDAYYNSINTRVVSLEQEIKSLRATVGPTKYSYGWQPRSLHEKHTELRRDLDLLLKKHKLCIKHTEKNVTLVSCKK